MAYSAFSDITDPEIIALRNRPEARRARWMLRWTVVFPIIILSCFFVVDALIAREYAVLNSQINGLSATARQSLLGQRVAFQADRFLQASTSAQRFEASQELYRAAFDMRSERAAARLAAPLPEALARLYESAPTLLDERVQAYTEAGIALSRVSFASLSTENEHYRVIAQAAGRLYTDLSSAQIIYQTLIDQTGQRIVEMNRGRSIFLATMLLLVGLLVIRPGRNAILNYAEILYKRLAALNRTVDVLEQRQRSQEALIESLPVAVGLFDAANGQTLYMNARFLGLLQHDAAALGGGDLYSLQSFTHPEDIQRALGCAQKAIQTHQPALGEYRLRRRDGSYVSVESRAIAVKTIDEAPEQEQLLTLIRDLSEPSIALREPLLLPVGLMDAFSQITFETVFLYDLEQGRLRYVSPSINDLIGYQPAEITSKSLDISAGHFIHPDDQKAYQLRVRNYLMLSDDEQQEDVIRLRHKDGTWHPIYLRVRVYQRTTDGKPHALIGLCSGLTVKLLSGEAERGQSVL
jgi:PAS domain S-box-containing protein